jgi:hypothetical protein
MAPPWPQGERRQEITLANSCGRLSMRTHQTWILLLVTVLVGTSGCVTVNSPIVQEKLKTVSAGYTGCMPGDNVLSNIVANRDGSGTWNATCKGKTYLCSAVATVSNSESFHCALAAQ